MTKNEFNAKFDKKYKETLEYYYNKNIILDHLKKYADENNNISTDTLFIESVLISSELNKKFLYSLLTDVLEFDD